MSFSTVTISPWLGTANGNVVGELSVASSRLPGVSFIGAVPLGEASGLTLRRETIAPAVAFAAPNSTVTLTTVFERITTLPGYARPAAVGSLTLEYYSSTTGQAIPAGQGILEADLSLLPVLLPSTVDETIQPLKCEAVMRGTAKLRSENKAITIIDLAKGIYALWGFDGIQDLRTIEIGRARIVQWINKALQEIYSNADKLEFFNRQRITVTVPSSGTVELPELVQRIHGEAQIAGRPLKVMTSLAQWRGFSDLYPGGSAPISFYVEATRAGDADSLLMTLYLAPVPADDTEVSLDVTMHPPRFDEGDLLAGALIPLPHLWMESILMPLVRKWAFGDSLMPTSRRTPDMSREIDAAYARALQQLGMAEMAPNAEKENRAP